MHEIAPDPGVPETRQLAGRSTCYGCAKRETGKQGLVLRHTRYPRSPWIQGDLVLLTLNRFESCRDLKRGQLGPQSGPPQKQIGKPLSACQNHFVSKQRRRGDFCGDRSSISANLATTTSITAQQSNRLCRKGLQGFLPSIQLLT